MLVQACWGRDFPTQNLGRTIVWQGIATAVHVCRVCDSCISSPAHSLMTYNRMMSVQAEALLARAPRHTGRRMAAIGSVSSVPSLKP